MSKWFSKGGLTALAKDIFIAPVNQVKSDLKTGGPEVAIIGQAVPLMAAGAGALLGGPFAAAAAYIATSNLACGAAVRMNEGRVDEFWPNIAQHRNAAP